MTWLIRPLTAADVLPYKSLRDEALECAPESFSSDHAASVNRPASAYAPRFGAPASGHFFLGAFAPDGPLLGCIGCERELLPQQRHSARLVSMMVAPAAQRRGIGQQLLAASIEQAAQVAGLEQLTLSVTASNHHVVRLYESAGFRAWGLLPRAIVVQGAGYDQLHMVRLLPSSVLTLP